MKENHFKAWKNKPHHGYLFRTRESVQDINQDLTNAWVKKSSFSSHVEGYLCAIQEEEISTNSLKAKRAKNNDINSNCHLCKTNRETIQHVVAACPEFTAAMYLPLRHNKVCNVIYQNVISKPTEKERKPLQRYDTKIKTLTKCQHNKPDLVLWKKMKKMFHY